MRFFADFLPRLAMLVVVLYGLQMLVADPICWSKDDLSCVGLTAFTGTTRSRKHTVSPQGVISTSHLRDTSKHASVELFKTDDFHNVTSDGEAHNHQPDKDPDSFGGVQARIYPSWTQEAIPCIPAETTWSNATVQKTPTTDGFLFLKTYKTGSSTASGIHIRMARNIAQRRNVTPICKSRFDHAWASTLYHNLNREQSFLWTIVRQPTARIVSQLFHFYVSRQGGNTTDESLIERIRTDKAMTRDHYLSFMSLNGYRPNQHDPIQIANDIMQQYDFIAVTERMDESVVAMAMLLNLPIADVMYLKAKGKGGFDDGGGGKCVLIQRSFVSDGMKEYFRTPEYREIIQWDKLVYQAANRSLDLTIESLGRDEFEKNLARFRQGQQTAAETCLTSTRFPCTEDGLMRNQSETDCLWKDSACGSECLDQVATELHLW